MLFGRRGDLTKAAIRRPWRLSAKLLIVSSVATVIGFSAICANVMLDMRRGEEELARQMLENLAAGIDADIGRNIELYDLSLRAVASNLVMPELKGVSKPILHLILFDHAATAKHFGAIQVFDASGQLTIDASSLDPRPENRSDEEYFQVHRDNPDQGLFISRPMLHRSAYSIVLSRRIADAEGRFLGVVAGSIRFSYFHELFDRLNLDADDTITVLRRDRTIIMRKPFDLDVIGKNLATVRTWNPNNLKASGSYAGQGPVDAIPRLFVRRASTGPFYVVVGKPLDAIFRLWQREVTRHRRHHGRAGPVRVRHDIVPRARNRPPRAGRGQARGDGDHRRAHRPEEPPQIRYRDGCEWRRAARNKTPVALLMIDADHFKTYNDTYGHQAGDQVLVGIAICISDSVRRAGDCTARFGGEEFAVLLPGISAVDALARRRKRPPQGRALVGGSHGHDRQHRRREHDARRRP